MRTRKCALVLLTWVVVLTTSMSCESRTAKSVEEVKPAVVEIERVLMHQVGEYTFLVRQENGQIGNLHIDMRYGDSKNFILKEDVSEDGQMTVKYWCGWFKAGYKYSDCKTIPKPFSVWRVIPVKLEIHIRSVENIEGAGWERVFGGRHKKTIKGNTVAIQ